MMIDQESSETLWKDHDQDFSKLIHLKNILKRIAQLSYKGATGKLGVHGKQTLCLFYVSEYSASF